MLASQDKVANTSYERIRFISRLQTVVWQLLRFPEGQMEVISPGYIRVLSGPI